MRITIKYDASWRNSFLAGSNNEPLPKGGRDFVGSMKKLAERDNENKYSNYIKREVTHDTVMGVLNRLIGDQRKLYQSREGKNYFFSDLESQITFSDLPNQNNETVFLRNITGSTDQNSFSGMVKANDPVFNSDYSGEFWGVLALDLDNLVKFIVDTRYKVICAEQLDPICVLQKLEGLNKLKAIDLKSCKSAIEILKQHFPDTDYKVTEEKIKPIELYCSALYLQVSRLSENYNVSTALTKKGGIAGIAKRGFTSKDFMAKYTTGNKKIIWGNPYQLKEKRKGEGEVVSTLVKASGVLSIHLNIPEEVAIQLKDMIEAAGVSSFYLGKKGLAYVESIRI